MVHYIKDDGEKVMKDKKVKEIKMESFTLGTIICRFTVPEYIIDEINNDYDNAIGTLPAHNQNLAGQIKDEFKVTDILSQDTKSLFQIVLEHTYKRYKNHFGMYH